MHEYFAWIKVHHEHECLKKPESPGTFELQMAVNHHVGIKNQTQVLRNSNHTLNPWASYPIPVVCTLTKENILFTASFKKKVSYMIQGWKDNSCLEQCTAFAEDLSAVPTTHITQLKTACNSAIKIWHLLTLRTPRLKWAHPYTEAYTWLKWTGAGVMPQQSEHTLLFQ